MRSWRQIATPRSQYELTQSTYVCWKLRNIKYSWKTKTTWSKSVAIKFYFLIDTVFLIEEFRFSKLGHGCLVMQALGCNQYRYYRIIFMAAIFFLVSFVPYYREIILSQVFIKYAGHTSNLKIIKYYVYNVFQARICYS